MNDGKHAELTEKIIGAFYKVYNTLGYGFRERVYQKSLAYELRRLGIEVEERPEILVFYEGQKVGEYEGDLLIGGVVLLELKGSRELCPEHEAQLLNYLKATRIEVGLLLNFGVQPNIKRKVFDNERKGSLVWTSPQLPKCDESDTD
ncbi:MAG TPA: GxxExxY protein [Pirellulaceae bacterium]|nr:GxxExxY protein [Pirellulaceae bacterium]